MGQGISLLCACGKKENITLGIGMMYPEICEETVDDIVNGVYGNEWKTLYESKKYIVIDGEKYLFYCEKCGCWEVSLGLDLYEPNNIEEVRKIYYGKKMVEESRYVLYMGEWKREQYYHLLKEYSHLCPKCKNIMIKTNDFEKSIFDNLVCTHCGKTMQRHGILMWD